MRRYKYMYLYDLDKKSIKKLKKLTNVRIQRKIVSSYMRTGGRAKNISLDIKTNTNSFLGNVEDWLTFEGDSKLGITKTYYYGYFSEDRLLEMKTFLEKKIIK